MREQRLKVKEFLASSGIHLAPSCADAFGAAVIAQLGFAAIHLSGHAVHKSLCLPDAGLATADEFATRISAIVDAVSLPLIVDGETGFGGVRNMRRTMRLLEHAGASAIHFEDQFTPRRYRSEGSPTIPPNEMVAKLKAALDERRDMNLAIIARSEERSSEAALIERLVTYAEAGVDALWSSGFSADVIRQVRAQAGGIPFIGIAPDTAAAAAAGVRIAVYPTVGIIAAAWGMTTILGKLREGKPPEEVFRDLPGIEAVRAWFRDLGEAQYAD
jgi:2-methylisocitrate lyase-like PEP mutase family enzyme